MRTIDNNTRAFLALVRAGLWKKDVRLLPYQDIKWQEVYRLATEQSVLGLVLAGLEHSDAKPPKELLLQWIGEIQQLEQRNKAMNGFVAELIGMLRKEEVHCLLVKGQGVAQCYERPFWRACGDVDLLLDENNYHKAKDRLFGFATAIDIEERDRMHLAMTIDSWTVELHGSLRGNMLRRVDKGIDRIQEDVFVGVKFRTWENDGAVVLLPAPSEDSLFIFTHILHHFTQGGIGLRQVCDWCRLLWKCRDAIDKGYLENRLKEMKLMSEWMVLGAMTVEYLGMPVDAMPFYSPAVKWKRKSRRICDYIIEVGNFGFNRDLSYKSKSPFLMRMIKSLYLRTEDFIKQVRIFPMDSVLAFFYVWKTGFNVVGRKLRQCVFPQKQLSV